MSYKNDYNDYRNYGSDSTKYVRIISSDFNAPLSMVDTAKRIISDEWFDRNCRRLAEINHRKQEVT